jgi:hypothetical protein
MQLPIGDGQVLSLTVAFPDQCGLIFSFRQVPVQAVVTDIGFTVDEPFIVPVI